MGTDQPPLSRFCQAVEDVGGRAVEVTDEPAHIVERHRRAVRLTMLRRLLPRSTHHRRRECQTRAAMLMITISRNTRPLNGDRAGGMLPSVMGGLAGPTVAQGQTTHCLGARSLWVTSPAPLF